MTIGEVKIEALKIMDLCDENDVAAGDLAWMKNDDAYREFLIRMTGAMNRAFGRIESLMVLPTEAYELTSPALEGERIRISLSDIPLLHTLMGVSVERENGYFEENYPFVRLGSTVIIDGIGAHDSVFVLYKPSIERVTDIDKDDKKVPLPEDMAALLPFYIKGELYRADEPNEAQEAMSWFEQRIVEAARYDGAGRGYIKTVYGMEGL